MPGEGQQLGLQGAVFFPCALHLRLYFLQLHRLISQLPDVMQLADLLVGQGQGAGVLDTANSFGGSVLMTGCR